MSSERTEVLVYFRQQRVDLLDGTLRWCLICPKLDSYDEAQVAACRRFDEISHDISKILYLRWFKLGFGTQDSRLRRHYVARSQPFGHSKLYCPSAGKVDRPRSGIDSRLQQTYPERSVDCPADG